MSHHILKLAPTDVLFFRDGRPMEGSSSGHGASWPLPNVLASALHHALRRSGGLDELHRHTVKRSGKELNGDRENYGRQFGSLKCAGPFPIDASGNWFFPRPADAAQNSASTTTHRPLAGAIGGAESSLAPGLAPVVGTVPPTKDKPEPWLSREAFDDYVTGGQSAAHGHFLTDDKFFGAEHNIGIGIDPETGTQDGERFYSASYLRLKEGVRIGIIGHCMDKGKTGTTTELDLLERTFQNSGTRTLILAGGQQRTCTLTRESVRNLPLPVGPVITGTLVRWTLLTPAIFPEIPENTEKHVPHHPGGWKPTWIDAGMKVQLKDPSADARKEREGRDVWRKRVAELPPIGARLVAASIPRALPVTGWSVSDTDDDTGISDQPGGARATHLAVPAGAVYYFECDDEPSARALAAALNWHGTSPGTEIQNRRSTLMGEKGFGLGVCSAWSFHKSSTQA